MKSPMIEGSKAVGRTRMGRRKMLQVTILTGWKKTCDGVRYRR